MKRLLSTIILGLAIATSTLSVPHAERNKAIIQCDTISRWDIFTQALIEVESGGNPNAIGPTGDLGLFQITPIYVKEANRLAKADIFTLDDRRNPDKSYEMFSIIQGHYNPQRDIDKAIRLHNPGAGSWYSSRIKKHMEAITQEYIANKANSQLDAEGNILIYSIL